MAERSLKPTYEGQHVAVRALREEELIRHLLNGYSLKKAADVMGVHVLTARKYARDEGFLQRLRARSQEAWERVDAEIGENSIDKIKAIEEAAQIALAEMIELAQNAKHDSVRMKACQDLMDRDPDLSRTQKTQGVQDHRFINPLTLQAAARAVSEEEVYREEKERLAKAKLIEATPISEKTQ